MREGGGGRRVTEDVSAVEGIGWIGGGWPRGLKGNEHGSACHNVVVGSRSGPFAKGVG